MSTATDIDRLRRQIDRIDRRILDLVSDRIDAARRIGEIKKACRRPVYDPEREQALLARLVEAGGGLPETAVRAVFGEIVSACRAAQEPIRVAYLGPEETHTHLAARFHFGSSVDFAPRATIEDVFEEVERGRASWGVVPAENSRNGEVSVTLDQWLESDLTISGEIVVSIDHALMSRETRLDRVEAVLSHPQALAQCRHWLKRNLPEARWIETDSTAGAARRVVGEPRRAALGHVNQAAANGLHVLAQSVQDDPRNQTRFFAIGRRSVESTGRDKTSLLFALPHRSGSLHRALQPLAEAGLNLTRIQSRPRRGRPWEYVFFVDFEGHATDPKVRRALDQLAAEMETLKVLGSYPAAVSESGLRDRAGPDKGFPVRLAGLSG